MRLHVSVVVVLASCSGRSVPPPQQPANVVEKPSADEPRALATSCDSGDAPSCARLGVLYAKGAGVPVDEDRAEELYRKACDASDLQGCINAAQRLGLRSSPNHTRAIDLSRAACIDDKPSRCHAIEWYGPSAMPPDYAQLESACEGGDATACFGQAAMLDIGHDVEADPSHAVQLYLAACQMGDAHGCASNGINIPRHDCENTGSTGCAELGLMYATGEGVVQDTRQARALFEKACAANEGLGCLGLAAMDPGRAEELRAKACELQPSLCD